jgi:acylphosphatase
MEIIAMAEIRKRVIISGRVQGVAFRAYTRAVARKAETTGWVRNLQDGRVEAVIEGASKNVDSVVSWCKTGPPSSRVEKVTVYDEQATGEFADFEITYVRGDLW